MWFALIFSIVPVVPVAALTYRWIERPALWMRRGEACRRARL
jgi:peptidoglycan/LPS O-acetylase OafA/YrhL